jgi:hypothetical protein
MEIGKGRELRLITATGPRPLRIDAWHLNPA